MIRQKLEQYGHIIGAEEYRAHMDGTYQLVNDTSVTVSSTDITLPQTRKRTSLSSPVDR